MTFKKLKVKRAKEKLQLVGWSIVSAALMTVFVSVLTADVEPSFFDSSSFSRDVLGVDQTLYRVVRVIDGDTFVVEKDGIEETVRLLGIDTPETDHPQKPIECFGLEASTRLRELLDDRYVRLEDDVTQADRDRYGRLLRYVYLPDETFVNDLLLREGFAFEYTYGSRPYVMQSQFMKSTRTAQEMGRGLWSEDACAEE